MLPSATSLPGISAALLSMREPSTKVPSTGTQIFHFDTMRCLHKTRMVERDYRAVDREAALRIPADHHLPVHLESAGRSRTQDKFLGFQHALNPDLERSEEYVVLDFHFGAFDSIGWIGDSRPVH